ncbi:PAN/Apple domain [Arabidopsis suecica]|uniref:non-specific serine/threonine protein kinase n=1 Tax=Arabidopsis suecica TaxID=45249 RepID=A0A8T2F3Z9_ARASU|nr:PAN/Apple domain [Arabidopsis suecica]
MRGVTPNYYHSYTFFFFFFVVLLALFLHVFSINTLSSTETLTISSNRTIVSPGNIFELGFFKTTTSSRNGDHWYLGIWYKSISERTYVWVANRDNPLSKSIGTLKISYANLVLLDHSGTLVWSTNLTRTVKSPVVAELLDNGNFVLRDSKGNYQNRFLWQSFDYPVDTLLPEMKIGRDLKTGHETFLSSWRSPYDPSSGDFSFKLGTQGLPEFYLFKKEFLLYRSGPWNGVGFSGIPTMQNWSYFDVVNNFIENREEVAYSFKVTDHSMHYVRFTLTTERLLQISRWDTTSSEWNLFGVLPTEKCDLYQICGRDSYCDTKTSPTCNCIKGFVPKNVTAWALGDTFEGCVRKSRLNCHRDGFFLLMKRMKLPGTSTAIVDKTIGLNECKERCSKDCNCTGFANKDIQNGGSGCVIWTGELMDMRNYVVGGQDLYVKIGLYN